MVSLLIETVECHRHPMPLGTSRLLILAPQEAMKRWKHGQGEVAWLQGFSLGAT